ncbi:MAG: hypothetical protein R3E96_08525 [Planctomycetota bacterium]
MEIRDAAFQAGRKEANRRYIDERREQFAAWKQYLQGLTIAYNDIVKFPDVGRWREITELRKQRSGQDLSSTIDPSEIELRDRMDSTYVTLRSIKDEDSLTTLIDILRSFSGLPMVVDAAAEDAVASAGINFNLDFANQITVRQALDFLTSEAGEDVTWTIRHETVLVTTKEKARGKPVIKNH